MNPTMVFGMTLYNNARHLPEAIDSLLAQTDGDFGLVMLDDASSDETGAIARGYAERDARIRYFRHPARQGMVATWREVVEIARRECPSATYFAWASDHDRWHAEWLHRTRAELTAHPEAVLAYCMRLNIDADGAPLGKGPKMFDTAGMPDPRARWIHFSREAAGAGDLVYGLMRVEALERAGIFRPVLLPDRLLMLELTLQGEFRQVPEVLWLRRTSGPSSVERQRATLFTEENAPLALWLPPWISHGLTIARHYVARPISGVGRAGIVWLIVRYQGLYLLRQYSKSTAFLHKIAQGGETVYQWWKEIRGATRWAIDDAKEWRKRWWGQTRRKWRRLVYNVAVTRRRVRAALYEAVMSIPGRYGRARRRVKQTVHRILVASHAARGRIRRGGRRIVYHSLVLTHRLGLRGRGGHT